MLINKVNNPRKYDWFVNVPGEFDCAEYLLNNCYDQLNAKTRRNVDKILLRSGKYQIAA